MRWAGSNIEFSSGNILNKIFETSVICILVRNRNQEMTAYVEWGERLTYLQKNCFQYKWKSLGY